MRTFTTPMMKQYMEIKEHYPDCLLFFRLGDFYELFLDDAKIGARVLDITLTKRPRGKDGDIPMAGVPHHAVDAYIARLVKAGHNVALCEQLSEPDGKGIVERGVVRVITPGTVMSEKELPQKEHNYTLALSLGKDTLGVAACDLSTGTCYATERPYKHLRDVLDTEIHRFNPSECILSPDDYNKKELLKILRTESTLNISAYSDAHTQKKDAQTFLKDHFSVRSLTSFGLTDKPYATLAVASLISYLQYTQHRNTSHITTIKEYTPDEFVILDPATSLNLELFKTIADGSDYGTLIGTLDHTHTAMGGRLLREWITHPLRDKKKILTRQNNIETLITSRTLRTDIQKHLKDIYDVERILGRLSVGLGNARDLISLSSSLTRAHEIAMTLQKSDLAPFGKTFPKDITYVTTYIDTYIVSDPSYDLKEGGLIQEGVSKELDELRALITEADTWQDTFQKQEREKTSITSLKIKSNNVFGFYIEVSNAHKDNVPEHYVRKQTMANAERYITDELKQHEAHVLAAEEKIHALEYTLFLDIVSHILTYTRAIQNAALWIATIDCYTSLAYVAHEYNYTKPEIIEKGTLEITQGRHVTVERLIDEQFVPNDVTLDHTQQQLLVITGPNMAGKSVFLRQVALITLLAHIGSYVPAASATIPLTDRIFVRSGARDAISRGLSTFMLEMVETAHILNHATPESLIIMDEIGRGTSTYDGISIAWAIAEYIVTHKDTGSKTLFATHYHELQELEETYPKSIKNYHVAVEEHKGKLIFLHTLKKGSAPASYGIAVADLAGVPQNVTEAAEKHLKKLESHKPPKAGVPARTSKNTKKEKLLEKLRDLDTDQMTPLEALKILSDIQKEIK